MFRKHHPRILILALCALLLFSVPASAEPSFEILGTWMVLDLSSDGSVAVGQSTDGLAEAVRWNATDGLVRLGRSAAAMTGRSAGSCQVSDDGLRVASSIGTDDSLYVTQGVWTKGLGWQQTMPPLGPNGEECDDNLGSAWGISGDGETLVGLYWVARCRAHANTWTSSGGLVDLGAQSDSTSSRANAVNYDGSVVVGWSGDPITNAWEPTVWEDGVLTVIYETEAGNECTAVNADGTMVAGYRYDPATGHNPSTLWIKTELGWQSNELGVLPGTIAGYGHGHPEDISADGSVVVGLNKFDWWNSTGFVWTLQQGLMSAADYFTAMNAPLPEGWVVLSLTAVSDDGTVFAGNGYDGLTPGAPREAFVVRLDTGVTDAPPASARATLRMLPALPNPFNPITTISLVLDEDDEQVQLEIFDSRGRLVRSLFRGSLSAGTHEMIWDGRDDSGATVTSGIYLARARGGRGGAASQKLTLVK